MKANEFIVEYNPVDQIRTSMYRNLGMGGDAGNEIAGRENFVNRFVQQVKQNQKSAGKSGMPLNVDKMVQSYLGQYGWVADPEQQAQLSKLANAVSKERGMMGGSALYSPNLKKLANAMYTVGSQQLRDPKTGLTPSKSGAGGAPGGTTGASASGSSEQLSTATEQLVQRIQKLVGPENNDDLERIAKTAMQVLYKQNPTAYTQLYKEIMTGETKKKVDPNQLAANRIEKQKAAAAAADASATPKSQPDTGENPNFVRGTNEARR